MCVCYICVTETQEIHRLCMSMITESLSLILAGADAITVLTDLVSFFFFLSLIRVTLTISGTALERKARGQTIRLSVA